VSKLTAKERKAKHKHSQHCVINVTFRLLTAFVLKLELET